MGNVVKTTVFMADMNDFADMNAVYAEFFTEPYPARSAVAVKTLPKEALVEIEVVAGLLHFLYIWFAIFCQVLFVTENAHDFCNEIIAYLTLVYLLLNPTFKCHWELLEHRSIDIGSFLFFHLLFKLISIVSQPKVHTTYGLHLPSEYDLLGNGTTCCSVPRRLVQSVPTYLFCRTIPKFGL